VPPLLCIDVRAWLAGIVGQYKLYYLQAESAEMMGALVKNFVAFHIAGSDSAYNSDKTYALNFLFYLIFCICLI
jgi:hypothetical protein